MKRFLSVIAVVLAMALFISYNIHKDFQAIATQGENLITIRVGASPTPHAKILEFIKPLMKEKGFNLEIIEYTDYEFPNIELEDGSLDANYFQTIPFLKDYNKKNGTNIVPVAAIHFEPLGIYPGNSKDLNNIKNGAKIGIPNDPSNRARALMLLQAQKIIRLREGATLDATQQDIIENPNSIQIIEIVAEAIPAYLLDLDYAVINGNYALDAGLTKYVLVSEAADSEAAKTYANVLAARESNQFSGGILALAEVLTSKEVSDYIKENFSPAAIPIN